MSTSFARLGDLAPISLYGAGAFQFGVNRHKGALLASPDGVYDWSTAASFDDPALLRFLDGVPACQCDLLLLGTGPKSFLLPPAFTAEVEKRGLGLEAMNTAAACRTYNILLGENRHFVAALLPV